VGEHRVDQLAARKQPVPRHLTGPVEVLNTRPRPGDGGHRRSRRQRWTRRIRRGLRSKRGKWVLVALACIAVLVIGLLAQGFLGSPAPAVHLPQAAGGGSLSTPPPDPSPSHSKGAHGHKHSNGQVVTDPVQHLRNVLPDNPLNHLQGGKLHEVTITATSAGPMPVIGYLVPTGMGSAYGSVGGHRSPWSLHEQALGSGYLAALFIQAGRDGQPVTCTITVDGKVTSRESTSGGYGRAVCLG
jgi:hypothetical protein